MQHTKVYEYAVIRIVPRVEREEFVNAGVILFCKSTGFLRCLYKLDREKVLTLWKEADLGSIEENLHSLRSVAEGTANSGPIGKLDAASRFRWLTAARSTVIQASKVHPGLCSDEQERLEKLFNTLVG